MNVLPDSLVAFNFMSLFSPVQLFKYALPKIICSCDMWTYGSLYHVQPLFPSLSRPRVTYDLGQTCIYSFYVGRGLGTLPEHISKKTFLTIRTHKLSQTYTEYAAHRAGSLPLLG